MSRYHVPKKKIRVEIRVSNSRFLATIQSASTVRQAQDFVRSIREEMPDATHHVYAFKIGYGASVSEGMSDDGEPSGTAGPPAMAVLRGSDVGDVVLVITRYFGGTKLGTGGLVAAYSEAAKAAFAALETEEKVERIPMELIVPYALLEPVRRILAETQSEIDDERFEEYVRLRFQTPRENTAQLTQRTHDVSAGKITPKPITNT